MFENAFLVLGRNGTAVFLLVVIAALVATLSLGPPSSGGHLRARGLLGR